MSKGPIRLGQVLRNGDGALVEGVFGDGLVSVDRAQTLEGHDLVVRGITGRILYHEELQRKIKHVSWI